MDLWTGPLPICIPCDGGRHHNCLDLLWNPRYGLMACGCDDLEHGLRDLLEDGAA